MESTSPDSVAECPACRDVIERSALYERWLIAENYADGAMLEAVGKARGFCTFHAARLLKRDSDIAGPIANFALRWTLARLDRQIDDRRGYVDALDPAALCPWCTTEREASEYSLLDREYAKGTLCQPHAQMRALLRKGIAIVRSPLSSGTPLRAIAIEPRASQSAWWSDTVTSLAEVLARSCAACDAACTARSAREAFLRSGPKSSEHWEPPRLCILHDVALGRPRTRPFLLEPDGIDRPCDWCGAIRRAADKTAELFALAYAVDAFREAYSTTAGLCLPHSAIALRRMPAPVKRAFALETRARVATTVWELDERAARRSWNLRDQGELADAGTLSHRAWWLIAGATFRFPSD
ncbi:MAG: hypothetical protein ACREMP_10760 [Candidatus Tyrphobacter sp.]